MSKAILVMDMPESCDECNFFFDSFNYPRCTVTDTILDYKFNGHTSKMDSCPLKEVPEKELLWYEDERDDYYLGWNHCVDYILEEEEL